MIGLLLKIKRRLPFIWRGVERVNTLLFRLLHSKRIMANANGCLERHTLEGFTFRLLDASDSQRLSDFLIRQPEAAHRILQATWFRSVQRYPSCE